MRRFALIVGVLMMTSCGGSDGGPPEAPQLLAGVVEVLEGDGQTDTVGQQLPQPILVRVMDTTTPVGSAAWGAPPGSPVPVPDQIVNFVVTSGGGQMFVGTVKTDSLGQAQNLWTLGPSAGAQCIEARAMEGGVPVTYATVCATAVPGPMAHAGFNADTAVVYGDSIYRIPAWATDTYGNAVAVPAPGNPDSLPLIADSLGYRTAFDGAGWYRLVLGGDTMVVAQHLPRGGYRFAFHHADTTWIEQGRLTSPNLGTIESWCTAGGGGALDAYTGDRLRAYRADSMLLTRQIGGGVVDTMYDGDDFNEDRACSALNYGLAPSPERFRLRVMGHVLIGWPGPYRETDDTRRIGTFTWILAPAAERADTLWFGLP